MAKAWKNGFIDELNELKPEDVQKKLIDGGYNKRQIPVVKEWLEAHKSLESSASDARREEREERAISIAREANTFALEANLFAWWARTIAIIALIIAAASMIWDIMT